LESKNTIFYYFYYWNDNKKNLDLLDIAIKFVYIFHKFSKKKKYVKV